MGVLGLEPASRDLPKGFDSVAAEPTDGRPTLPENDVADGFLLEAGPDIDKISEFDADGQAELNRARKKVSSTRPTVSTPTAPRLRKASQPSCQLLMGGRVRGD
jgi:hypothetical protein